MPPPPTEWHVGLQLFFFFSGGIPFGDKLCTLCVCLHGHLMTIATNLVVHGGPQSDVLGPFVGPWAGIWLAMGSDLMAIGGHFVLIVDIEVTKGIICGKAAIIILENKHIPRHGGGDFGRGQAFLGPSRPIVSPSWQVCKAHGRRPLFH